jgi:hypothetical protein
MSDNQGYERTPLWGWVLYVIASRDVHRLAVKTLGTGAP